MASIWLICSANFYDLMTSHNILKLKFKIRNKQWIPHDFIEYEQSKLNKSLEIWWKSMVKSDRWGEFWSLIMLGTSKQRIIIL